MVDGESRRLGSYIETRTGGERVRAYMPTPLPPDRLSIWGLSCDSMSAPWPPLGVSTV
jgi:hypothetical protein